MLEADIKISMCGRGRCYDNILIEHPWRSKKYEEVYLNERASPHKVRARLLAYFTYYYHQRPHQGLQHRTPYAVHTSWLEADQTAQLARP